MSEVRYVRERVFASSDAGCCALMQAGKWVEDNDVEIDVIVGDAEYVMVYYTEDVPVVIPEIKGPGTDIWDDPYISPFAPVYTLRGRTV